MGTEPRRDAESQRGARRSTSRRLPRRAAVGRRSFTSTLKALDEHGVVLHVGTFSKLIAPGLRMGWIAAEPALIARLIQLKSDGGSSPLIQRIVLDFVRSPAFAEHIDRVRRVYAERRDTMVAAFGTPDVRRFG